jgi:hypothetical protein
MIFSTWLNLLGVITPADIAHSFIETHKPPHHDKVQSRKRIKLDSTNTDNILTQSVINATLYILVNLREYPTSLFDGILSLIRDNQPL